MEGTNPALLVLPRMTGYFPLFIPRFLFSFRSPLLAHGWGGAWAGPWGPVAIQEGLVRFRRSKAQEFSARAAT